MRNNEKIKCFVIYCYAFAAPCSYERENEMYRFILVEDDYSIRTGLSRFFPWDSLGFRLMKDFENGQKALDYLRANTVDVVLTDIKMPVMDGLTLAKELKSIAPSTLVIFLSAYRSFEYAREALDYGVRNYIVKSTKYDDLIEIFKKIHADLDAQQDDVAVPSSDTLISDNRMIRKILEYIDKDIANVSLQYLADKVRMNPVYLSRLFKEKTGVNFSDYILKKRMEAAASFLVDTDYSIYDISGFVGYSNDKNFSRAFKNFYNTTPSQFRHSQGRKL